MLQFLPALASAGANILGGILGRQHQDEQFERNAALQREFAQSGIQWKVADAKKAGIHPLYAMGAPSISPAVSVQGDPMGAALSSMGSDISRAALASSSQETRNSAFNNQIASLTLERGQLQNELLRSQIMRMRVGQVGPPIPTGGESSQGDIPIPTPDPRRADFDVPENKKIEERPPLMMSGSRWLTNPNTSPMKAWEDQYGDEGPVAATLPLFILWNDMVYNYGQPSGWPTKILNRWADAVESYMPERPSGRHFRTYPLGRR